MKKNHIVPFIGAAVILSGALGASASANAGNLSDPWNNWYGSISGDLSWIGGYDTGGGGNIAIGYQFWPTNFGDFRLEAEGGFHAAEDVHYFTYMGNLYYDFTGFQLWSNANGKIVPYIGAGLGDATIHLGMNDGFGRYCDHDDVFAYQLMVGLSYTADSMPNTAWSLGYRFLGSSSTDAVDNAGFINSENLHTNNIELAYRMYF